MNLLQNGLISLLFPTYSEFGYGAALILLTLVTAVAGYLLGSVNSAVIVSKKLFNDDVRNHGSGNPGLTNMLRTFGPKAALLTLAGDFGKTALAVLIGGLLGGFNYVPLALSLGFNATGIGVYTGGFFAVVGHIFPVFYKFKGGKGVLALATVALILSPIPFLLLFGVFALVLAATKYVSLASVTAAVLYPVAINGYFQLIYGAGSTPGIVSLLTILSAILIVARHMENLQRISDRTENKFSFGKKKEPTEDEHDRDR